MLNYLFSDAVSLERAMCAGVRDVWCALAALAALSWLAGCGALQQPRCEEITIPMCRGIGYNLTSFPNALDHDTQEEAGLEVGALPRLPLTLIVNLTSIVKYYLPVQVL